MFLYIYLSIGSSITVLANPDAYPELDAESAVVMDAKTGQILFEKNMHQKQYPASITKIMTGMLAIEKGNLNDTLTISKDAVFSIGRNSSHIALDVDEKISLKQALYALSVASANDAANGIAEHIAGNQESFARLMNERAEEAGAKNTNFVNAHGLPDDDQYTTAYDMARIMKQAIKEPEFVEIFQKNRYQIPPTNEQSEKRYLVSRNRLLNGEHEYEGVIASKTGWTSQANHTLVTAAEQSDRELIVVVLNNQSMSAKFEDTIDLLDYGFKNFKKVTFDVKEMLTTSPDLNLVTLEGLSKATKEESGEKDELKINEEREKVKIEPGDRISRLLHNSLSYEDIEVRHEVIVEESAGNLNKESAGDSTDKVEEKVEEIKEIEHVKISINLKQANQLMFEDLGDELVTIKKEVETEEPAGSGIISVLPYVIIGIVPFIFVYRKKRTSKRRRKYGF